MYSNNLCPTQFRLSSCNLKWVSIFESSFLVGSLWCGEFFVFFRMGVVTVAELKPSISGKRSFRPSSSIRHATEW